jgi:hypothetical protein
MSDVIAVKVLNQYRKRDIISYLGLRYYFNAKVARECRWIKNVCTRLAVSATQVSYLRTYHFKDFKEGRIEHRDIYLPTPNEILAESALLIEVSKYEEFRPKPYVYSYRFSKEDETSGVFQPYFDGFKERHRDIAAACRESMGDSGVVFYTDIKKFYPSIRHIDALFAWERACDDSKIEDSYRKLGKKILGSHNDLCLKDGSGNGVLTGPLFSHMIANLLLDDIDVIMHKETGGKYWRYVDDVIFVGSSDEIFKWRQILELKFEALNLKLHDGEKDFQVSCCDWLKGENDFSNNFGNEWISLIGNVKRFLLANPLKTVDLQKAFQQNHVRIPIVDYSNAVKESTFLQKFQDWRRKYKWAANAVRAISIDSLLRQAVLCEIEFSKKLESILSDIDQLSGYEQKRRLPKLRYLAGRLLYLLGRNELSALSLRLESIPELFLLTKTMGAVASLDMTDVVCMGGNAAHISAQLIRTDCKNVTIHEAIADSPIVRQSLAIIELNGLTHNFKGVDGELGLFAKAEGMGDLMSSHDGFIKELACLHGALPARHQETLDSSFDRNEELALDVLNQLQNSNYL